MNCETSYTDCCEIEVVKASQGLKMTIGKLTLCISELVIAGAEDMSKTK